MTSLSTEKGVTRAVVIAHVVGLLIGVLGAVLFENRNEMWLSAALLIGMPVLIIGFGVILLLHVAMNVGGPHERSTLTRMETFRFVFGAGAVIIGTFVLTSMVVLISG